MHEREDLPLFDDAFERFWRKPAESWGVEWQGLASRRSPPGPLVTHPPLKQAAPQTDDLAASSTEQITIVEVTRTYSDREILRHKNFAEMDAEESEAVKQMISHLLWQVSERRTRRKRPGKGHLIDLRRTLRTSLRSEGEILNWSYQEPKRKPRSAGGHRGYQRLDGALHASPAPFHLRHEGRPPPAGGGFCLQYPPDAYYPPAPDP